MHRSSPNRPRGRVRAFFVGAVALLSFFLSASAWAQVVINPTAIPGVTAGEGYDQILLASGGTAPYSFVISSGALPPGMDLLPQGRLIGTPRQTGFFSFTVQATDANSVAGDRPYTLTVATPTIVLPATTLTDATNGASYFATLNGASGGNAPYSYYFYGGGLPTGLFLNGNGTLTGTPSESGDFSFSVIATDSTSGTGPFYSAPRIYNLRVIGGAPPQVADTSAIVSYGSSSNGVPLTLFGSPATSVAVATPPSHGTATAVGMTITYTPTSNFSGPDSFTYIARNAAGDSAPATADILVTDPTISVSASGPFTAQIGVPYTQTFTWNGGSQPYGNFAAAILPAGLSITATSANSMTVSGTPTASGSYSFTVSARDSSIGVGPFTFGQNFNLSVSAPTLTLTPAAGTLNAAYGTAYSQQYTAGGGTGPYAYSISAGALPAGLSLDASTGVLSGTPTVTGLYTFSVRARDSSTGAGAPFARTQNYVMQVTAPTISVSPAMLTAGTAGVPMFQQLTASGGMGSYTYSAAGTLPNGIVLNANGELSGMTNSVGSYNFSATATDANGQTGSRGYTLVIDPPTLTLTASTSLDGTAAVFQTAVITASGGVAPYSYALVSGGLPVGMSFNSAGVLQGLPRSNGNYSLRIRATDSLGNQGEQIFDYTIAPASIVINPASLPDGTRNQPYNAGLSSTGGIAPYTYLLESGSLAAGMSFSSAGTISGTPVSTGSYSVTIRSTDSAGYSSSKSYTFAIDPPTITLGASGRLDGTVGVAQSATLTATGGSGSYSYTLASGMLPVGMTFNSTGVLAGTPLSGGLFALTIIATDSNGNLGSGVFSFAIAEPVIVITPPSVNAGMRGSAYSQTFTASGGVGPYSYTLASGALPTGLVLSAGGVLSGTPTVQGSFGFILRATDSLGFEGVQPYTLAINAAPPTSADDSASVLSGESVSIDVTDNDSGTITSIAIATPPTHGSAVISGLDVLYTPAAGYSGSDSFTYTATGSGGISAPATVTVTVNPLPVAQSRTLNANAGIAIEVDLTEGATGGPFTAATLVSLTPAQAGSASIAQQGSGNAARYVLTFTPAAAFSGVATATFTLDNAFATSAEATITFQVTARPDPTLDAEVQGLLGAQAQATRRFANAQLNNFQRRLESLHHGGTGFSNGLSFQANTPHCRDGMPGMPGSLPKQLCDAQTAERDGANPGLRDASASEAAAPSQSSRPFGLWTGGAIRSGNQDSQNNRARVDFETDGLSVGGDYRLNDRFALGLGLGWGRDDSEIGNQGSRSKGKAYTLAGYASYHPGKLFLDALVGYQDLSYELRRYVSASGSHVSGSRDGGQWFASLSTGADLQYDRFSLTPYARLDLARATLDAYTEQGDALYALHYQDMDVDSSTGNLGLRMDFSKKTGWGTLTPQLRLEYQYDFQGNGSATMQYADLMSGPFYRTSLPVFDRSRFLLGLGLGFNGEHGLSTRIEYNGVVDANNGSDHGVMINIEKRY